MLKKLLYLLLASVLLLPLLAACQSNTPNVPDEPHVPDEPNKDPAQEPGDDKNVVVPVEPEEPVVVGEGAVIGKTKYYTKDVVVANIIATDAPYHADPTGQTDSANAIQAALYDMDEQGGGVVFLPAGDYLVTHSIFVPSGCVLQGDWQNPDEVEAGKAEYGTVILAKPTALTAEQLAADTRSANPLFVMDGCSGMVGLTFYYPEQNIAEPVPYGYTIYSEKPSTAVLCDITMINSYRGIGVGTTLVSAHELFQNESIHICALDTGVEMYCSSEVGYTVDLTVSPKYWIEAGRGWACDDATALRDHCREHTIGLIIQKLDDEDLSTLRFDWCRTAIYMPRVEANRQDFWGLIYDVTVTNSTYGIVIEGLSPSIGAIIAKAEIDASEKAIVNSSTAGTLKLSGIKLTGKGGVHAEGGDVMYDEETDLSAYEIRYGEYRKPVSYLYNVDITKKSTRAVDAAPDIQKVLDEAAETGGIVYLPAGVYSLYTPITVPANVQLRGPIPVFIRDGVGQHPDGCVLLTYIKDGAAINLEENAGVNGLRIFCPLYDAGTALTALESGAAEVDTCTAIKGLGSGVYAYNVGVTATMIGIDFSGCDNHLIKQAFGCVYNTFAIVGGKNGVVESCLNNPHFINRQSFASLGYCDEKLTDIDGWKAYSAQNEGGTAETGFTTLRDKVLRAYCTMVKVVDATDQAVNNIFMYAPYELISVSNSTATLINTSADFVGFGSVYHVQNGSQVVAVNALRSAGDSLFCDETSMFDIYNRVNTEIYYEGDFHWYDSNVDDFSYKVRKKTEIASENNMSGVGCVTLNTDKNFIKDGEYSYKHEASADGTSEVIMTYSFDAIDISAYMNSNSYLHMWIYAEDMSTQLWGGRIELTSSGRENSQMIYWVTTSFVTHNGWNEIWLPLGDVKTSGDFNAEKVNFLRIYNTNNYFLNQGDFYIDDIYFCTATSGKIRLPMEQTPITSVTKPRSDTLPATVSPIPDEPAQDDRYEKTVINNCDTVLYPVNSVPQKLNYDPDYIKEGSGSYLTDAGSRKNGEEIFCFAVGKDSKIADISRYMQDGYLHFWLYIDGDYHFTNGQMELSSSGMQDKAEIHWDPVQFSELKQGWNEIVLPLAQASKNSEFDPSKLNFMRLYIFTDDKQYGKYYIDDIYFYRTKSAGNEETSMRKLVIDNCDQVGNVGISVKMTYDPAFVKEGTGSYLSEGSKRKNGNELFLLRNTSGGWNISEYMKDGYLHLWVYFTDAEVFKAVELEVTSSGNCDKQEMNWQISHFRNLKQGWNEIILPLAEASNIASDFNPEKANFIRMFTITQDGTWGDYYIDDVYFFRYVSTGAGDEEESAPPTVTPTEEKYVIANCDTLNVEGLSGGIGVTGEKAYVKEGTGAWHRAGGVDVFAIKFPEAIDISAYRNGYLHVWVWISDHTNIKSTQFEMTSGGQYDQNELNWNAKNYLTEDGWNEVWLPLSDAGHTNGDFDFTHFNYMRLYVVPIEGNNTYYIDDIYLTNSK